MSDLFPVSLNEMIACVVRELVYRERVYPRQVAAGRMTDRKADHELQCMRAVLTTLLKLMTEAA